MGTAVRPEIHSVRSSFEEGAVVQLAIKLFGVMIMVAFIIIGTSLVCYFIYKTALAVIIGATLSTFLALALAVLIIRGKTEGGASKTS